VKAVRGEPDYADQVPRKLEYERAHPDVVINYRGAHWQAIVRTRTARQWSPGSASSG
jgi:hypothetical protein